ncbi:Transcriptional regulator SlyA (plasmid) [Sphingobium sp. AntQ-1]|uniref:MarR family winged helix-turn-helix transcriptional regulator n=1 Tax=Sphingobium sp. AntQ-1 TaxID=2930091 RepID=UPI00234ECF5A|nr:MarR family transcriptional regulator [Sphingobium sp. AntQ-1]WCP15940.1 Transcriptional regulator SlyA [Sphingobium sp. AntQ-1]
MAKLKSRLDPEVSVGYQVRLCHRRIDRLLNAYLAEHGIGSGFWYYLRILWQQDGLTQKNLSDAVNVAENSTVVTVTAMGNRGLVHRVRDAFDRRKVRISLTKEGRALESKLIPYAHRINEIAVEGIDPADVTICLSVLKRAANNIGKELDSL